MNKLALLLSLLLLSSCCCVKERVIRVPMEENIYLATQEISSIILHYAQDLRHDMNLFLHHSYATRENGDMILYLDFTTQEILDVDEARRMMVHTVEGLLKKLNREFTFKDSISNYPFTFGDLYVSIELESYFTKYVDPLYVARAVLSEGFLFCAYAETALDYTAPIFHKHCEPYASSLLFTEIEDQIDHDKPVTILPTGSKDDRFYYPSEKRRYK